LPSFAQQGAARCAAVDSATAAASGEFELQRAVVTATFPAGEKERQQVAFACDATAALRFMLRRAGTKRADKQSVLVNELMLAVKALATSEQNAATSSMRRAHTHARTLECLSRTAIEADLDMIGAALEAYALSVLTHLDGDPEPPTLESALRPALEKATSALKTVLRAMLPEEDRAAQAARREARRESGAGAASTSDEEAAAQLLRDLGASALDDDDASTESNDDDDDDEHAANGEQHGSYDEALIRALKRHFVSAVPASCASRAESYVVHVWLIAGSYSNHIWSYFSYIWIIFGSCYKMIMKHIP
jgi:hypothetical protein